MFAAVKQLSSACVVCVLLFAHSEAEIWYAFNWLNGKDRVPIRNERELEFAVYCIENVAAELGKSSDAVYRALTGPGDILNQYIVPCYDVLRTQGREYIVTDIREVMAQRGVSV